MTYLQLAYLHLGTILPAFIIATYLLLNRKGTAIHKFLGKIYMVLMLFTSLVTLFMPAGVGPALFGHFGFIHILSVFVFYSVTQAYFAIRKGDIKTHKANMVAVYIGGLLIAGGLTFLPGRLMHSWLFT